METQKRTCFVVSPIGEEDSEVRQKADDAFDLLIEPALEVFNFDVIRADKIPGPGNISEDLVRLIQESELCIVDLTGDNPNVFYECGRRHESGKPAVLIIEKQEGQRVPFDLSGLRYVKYDLSTPKTTRDSVQELQSYVRAIDQGDFAELSSGATLTNIMETLGRIERRITNMAGGPAKIVSPTGTAAPRLSFKQLFVNPNQAFYQALMEGDVASIVALLPRMEHVVGLDTLILAAGIVARNGEPAGVSILMRIFENNVETLEADALVTILASLVEYYSATDREKEGLEDTKPLFERAMQREDLSDKERARILNQRQRCAYGAADYSVALEIADRVISLNPEEPAYWYNRSLIYEAKDLLRKALEDIEKCLSLVPDTEDASHLGQAYEIYMKVGQPDKANDVMERLEHIDHARATFLRIRYT